MTSADRRISAIATGQLGAFTRAQANDVGLSDRQLRSRVQSGFLVRTGPNTFRSTAAPTSPASDLTDVMIGLGDESWVSHQTAAALHGFDGYTLRRPFHVTVPRERSLNRWNVKVHRTGSIDIVDRDAVDGLAVTTATRTLIDIARTASAEQLAAALDSALRDGLTSESALHRRIVAMRSKGRYGLPLLHAVLAGHEVTRGGQSWLEREYLRLLAAAGMLPPLTQQVLTRAGDQLVRVDCRFPGTNVVVELLGYRFHRTQGEMSRDAARMNALIADGFRPVQFTYAHVVSDQAYVVEATRSMLVLGNVA